MGTASGGSTNRLGLGMFSQWIREIVDATEQVTEVLGAPGELVLRKQLDHLDRHMRTFIEESPFLVLGTVSRSGLCDVSPRGDAHGLARVLDDRTLILPDRRGNRRADSLNNIVETGRAGLLFLIPGRGETLRVNGLARVFKDREVLAAMAVDGRAPDLGIAIRVEEAFLQCAKAVIRSGLWEPVGEDRASSLPGLAEILHDQTRLPGQTVEGLRQQIEESYSTRLY